MKKCLIIFLFSTISFISFSIEVELKLGFDMYRSLSADAKGDRPTGIYPGGSIGIETLMSENNRLRYGLGMVWHNSANGKNGYEGHSTSPLYLVGKYELKDNIYIVARGGWAFSKAGDTTYVQKTDGGLYGAFGVGKIFLNDRMNIECLYEIMEYKYITRLGTTEDGYYQIFSAVVSYKIKSNN